MIRMILVLREILRIITAVELKPKVRDCKAVTAGSILPQSKIFREILASAPCRFSLVDLSFVTL